MADQYRFDTQAAAEAFVAQVSTALGYPKPGVDVGDGVHAEESMTTAYTDASKHPTLDRWAVRWDETIAGLVDGTPALLGSGVLEERTSDWDVQQWPMPPT